MVFFKFATPTVCVMYTRGDSTSVYSTHQCYSTTVHFVLFTVSSCPLLTVFSLHPTRSWQHCHSRPGRVEDGYVRLQLCLCSWSMSHNMPLEHISISMLASFWQSSVTLICEMTQFQSAGVHNQGGTVYSGHARAESVWPLPCTAE